MKSLIRHLGLAIGNVRHVRFSWTLTLYISDISARASAVWARTQTSELMFRVYTNPSPCPRFLSRTSVSEIVTTCSDFLGRVHPTSSKVVQCACPKAACSRGRQKNPGSPNGPSTKQCSGLSWKSCRSWSEFWEIQTLICKEMCKKFLVLTKSCRSRTDGPALVSNTATKTTMEAIWVFIQHFTISGIISRYREMNFRYREIINFPISGNDFWISAIDFLILGNQFLISENRHHRSRSLRLL